MCDEVQAQVYSLKSLNGDLVAIEQGSSEDFADTVQLTLAEMENGGQVTIDEHREINLGTTDDSKPIFVSTMLKDNVVWYEQPLREYKDVFAWGYQDMRGLDPNVIVHKLVVSEGVKSIK